MNTELSLRAAAAAEFNEVGYEGTNTNRIARRAGFAPQTFYRHFADKLAVFLAVYKDWQENEIKQLLDADDLTGAARSVFASHRRWLRFRRSLRALAYAEPAIAAARANAREAQVEQLQRRWPERKRDELLLDILVVERLADAAAEGELKLLGIKEEEAHRAMTRLFLR